MTAVPVARRRVRQWYADPVSCLHSTLATLLIDAGEDPLDVLGLGWEFRRIPGDVRAEEFYWPCRAADDLVGSVLPHHPASSRWRTAPAADPLSALTEALAAGRLPIVAVDNYHLPFRPAYHDVHAAHLLVVYDVDAGAGTVGVSDAMPPAYAGPLASDDLLRAWWSANPPDTRDVFFSGAGIGGRWLDVRLRTPFGALTVERLRDAVRANLRELAHPSDPDREGLAGLARFAREVADRARRGDAAWLAEVYTLGWSLQAQSALHGELLRRCGSAWRLPELSEAGRRVERVAHLWTAVRVGSAHARDFGAGPVPGLPRHVDRLRRAYEEAVAELDEAVSAL